MDRDRSNIEINGNPQLMNERSNNIFELSRAGNFIKMLLLQQVSDEIGVETRFTNEFRCTTCSFESIPNVSLVNFDHFIGGC